MGHARPRPSRLAEKLLQIRIALGLSQPEMHKRLGVEDQIEYNAISKFELDRNEPSLIVLLQYARLANIYMEALVDDDLDLPTTLPALTKTEGIRRKSAPQRMKK